MAPIIKYSSDDAMESLIDRDQTAELIGYVDEITGVQEVGQRVKYKLFKFFLSNRNGPTGTKRIVCLIWGDNLISQYKNEITIHRILHFDGAHTKALQGIFCKNDEFLVPFELIVQKNTVVKYLGHHTNLTESLKPVQKVTFEDIGKSEGFIVISGYVKTEFVQTTDKFDNVSYGCGSITDKLHKVTVKVSHFTPINAPKGSYVTVTGEVKPNAGPIIILCKDSSCVVIDAETPSLNDDEIAELFNTAIKTPKRGISSAA